jgi:hypothetical protein
MNQINVQKSAATAVLDSEGIHTANTTYPLVAKSAVPKTKARLQSQQQKLTRNIFEAFPEPDLIRNEEFAHP